jgi:hypothetical protein
LWWDRTRAATELGEVTCVAPHQTAACAPCRRRLRFSETPCLATLRVDLILSQEWPEGGR